MFRSTLTECSFLFTDSLRFQSWEKREKDTFKSIIALRRAPNPQNDNRDANFRFAYEMTILREEMKHEKWTNIWIRVWKQSYRRRELIGLAALRRDRNLDLDENDGNVFLLALDEDHSDFIFIRSISWLNSASTRLVVIECQLVYFSRLERSAVTSRSGLGRPTPQPWI